MKTLLDRGLNVNDLYKTTGQRLELLPVIIACEATILESFEPSSEADTP